MGGEQKSNTSGAFHLLCQTCNFKLNHTSHQDYKFDHTEFTADHKRAHTELTLKIVKIYIRVGAENFYKFGLLTQSRVANLCYGWSCCRYVTNAGSSWPPSKINPAPFLRKGWSSFLLENAGIKDYKNYAKKHNHSFKLICLCPTTQAPL